MGNNGLPEGWEIVNLEECVDILDSQRIPINATERNERISGKSEDALFPYYGATGQVGWIDDFIFNEELVLLGEDGAPFLEGFKQKAYIIRGKTWVNNHAHVLRAINGIALNSFLKHYLDIFDYHEFVTGTTRLKLNQSQMRKIPVILPPFPEQERIVARIEETFTQLEAGVAELQNAKAQLKRYRAAVLKSAVEGELTREWREMHRGEKTWKEVKIKEIADIIDPHPSHRTPPRYENGIPYVGMGDIGKDGKFDLVSARKVSPKVLEEHQARYTLQDGDFIFGKIGTIGKPFRLRPPFPYTLSANIILVQPQRELVDPGYLFIFMASPIMDAKLQRDSLATTQAAFGIKKARELIISIPPKDEQQRIVDMVERRLSVADEIEKELDESLPCGDDMVRAERLQGVGPLRG